MKTKINDEIKYNCKFCKFLRKTSKTQHICISEEAFNYLLNKFKLDLTFSILDEPKTR